MSEPVIRYVPRDDVTPERERETLARIYAFVLRSREDRRVARTGDKAAPCPQSERRLPNEPIESQSEARREEQ
jgi:hypothetical protein